VPATDRSRLRRLASGVAMLLVTLGVGRYALARAELMFANHDVGWFLHSGEIWLDGGRIGVDIIDTNPPLVTWLSGLEVLVARKLDAAPFVVHALVTCAIGLLGVGLAMRAFVRAGISRDALALWGPITMTAATRAAGYDFGQRDHWLALLLLPYAGWALVPGKATLERALAGLLAALAVALKPHHLLAVVVIELFGLMKAKQARHLFRLEALILPACALLYVLAISWSAPSYWTEVKGVLSVYAAYDSPVPLWGEHAPLVLAALVVAAPIGVLRPRTPAPCLLAVLSLSGWFAVHVQQKNFPYHNIPTEVFACAALALALALLLARVGPRPAVALALALVTLGCLKFLHSLPLVPRDARRLSQHAHFQRFADGGTLFMFSAGIEILFPALNFSTARSISPYGCLWPIPGNYTPEEWRQRPFRYRTLAEMPALERRMVERIVAVLTRERPDLLIFDRRPVQPVYGLTSFDHQRYFEAHPDFVELLRSYESVARDDDVEYYGRSRE
jgi:hypothetical protein